jgi:XRE family transcriptional regulator, aerobic/anaerobic benzoate catabolism transcriptional regulator
MPAGRKLAQAAREDSEAAPLSRPDYLRLLGARVRDARARHGMTRRMLARDSGISERYLAELESGRGNFSIVLLRRLASAIDVSLSELVDEQPPPSVEYVLLAERLRRLSSSDLESANELLTKRFGDLSIRRDRIALIGLRGAGKSTLGALLAEHLGWEFVELSREIESVAGVAVDEIFDLWGQAAYRRYERRALERILRSRTRFVIATAGGLVSEPSTFQRLLESCWTIWLKASPREHWDRVIGQGDLRVREGTGDEQALVDMRRILAQRDELYGKADARVITSGKTVRQALKELVGKVDSRH